MIKKLLLAICIMAALSLAAQIKTEGNGTGIIPPVSKLGKHLLTVAPLLFTENGVGFSVGYERALDANSYAAFSLPLVGTFNTSRRDIFGHRPNDPMFYLMPGFKFYPTGNNSKAKYALGPSFVIGFGKTAGYDDFYYLQRMKNKFILGVLLDNSLNLNITNTIYLGLNFGFGFTWLRFYDGENQGIGGLVNGSCKFGFRLR